MAAIASTVASAWAGLVGVGGWGLAHAHAAQAQAANAPAAHAAPASNAASASHSTPSPAHSAGPPKAPNKPPLGTGAGKTSAEEEASASAALSSGDPIASNGLNSPLCKAVGLPDGAARDCRSSGFEGAEAPTGNYGLDVHIDTGATKLGNDVAVEIENILQFLWTALVAVVRGVIVVLDWCYTIDLLHSPAMHRLTQSLQQARATFTKPWLALVLVIASVLALYHGLIRRRVAETLGEALLMIAMMAGGLWVIMNPAGTIGALGAWANQASLGTLAAAGGHSPDHADRTLAESNHELFKVAIDAPWCFMEFGDVSWCNAKVGSRLAAAAKQLEAEARAGGEGEPSPGESTVYKVLNVLTAPSAVPDKILKSLIGASGEEGTPHVSLQSATLLRGARTNGELFLAVPANGQARNSINDKAALFKTLCGSNTEPCRGPTASEAEFRTQSGVWWRGIGLAFVAFGLLGMLLLFGFIAWHLLLAAFMSLIYLLLTPAAVLLPALGEAGRSAFRTWVTRLLGAVTSKLIYSFLLGALLMVTKLVSEVDLVGWFLQWLVLSSLWWIIYCRRHSLFDIAHVAAGRSGERRSVVRRMSDVLESRKGMAATRWAKRKMTQPGPSVERRRRLAQAGRERAEQIAGTQVAGGLEHKHREASALVAEGDAAQGRISAKRRRLDGIKAAHAAALSKAEEAKSAREGALNDLSLFSPLERDRAAAEHEAEEAAHRKRAARLQHRMNGLQDEIDGEQSRITVARQTVKAGDQAKRTTGKPYTRMQAEEFGRHLDEQAKLPRSQRDNAGMAGVVGMTPGEYERLGPRDQLKARLGIDREMTKRRELDGAVADMAESAGSGGVGWRDKRKGSRELEGKLGVASAQARYEARGSGGSRPGGSGGSVGSGNGTGNGTHSGGGDGAASVARIRARRSTVLEDARQVEARRKRQLGRDRL